MDAGFGQSPEMMGATGTSSFYSTQFVKGTRGADPKAAAGQFEAMFYRILFQQMRDTELADPMFDSPGLDQLTAMQHDELASHLGNEGHLGIKGLVMDEILGKQSLQAKPESLGLLKPARGELS